MSYTKALKRLQTIRAHVAPNLVEETKGGDSPTHSDSMLRNVSNSKASIWSGFHQKPIKDRLNLLKRLYPTLDEDIFLKGSLTPAQADMMVENCVGKIELPLGLGLNFLINGKEYVVPMALEEPSVIAAASSVAKFVSERGGGFKVHTTAPVMASQIVFIGVNYSNAKYLVDMNSQKIVDFCNSHCRVMVSYGGGCRGVRTKKIYELQTEDESRDVMVVELLIDVQESMGMNLCNTLAER